MKNPLRKRIPRELKSDFGKYFVILVLMILSIGLTSGFLVAGDSLLTAYNEGFEKYNVEDGKFETTEKMNKAQVKSVNALGVTAYEMFCMNTLLDDGSTMRVYKKRTTVDTECLMEGEFPANTGEIAIDRMYADNNELKIGDSIKSEDGKYEWKIVGLVALPDYSCLYENNNDTMFDAQSFGVGVCSEEEFESFDEESLSFWYSWIYDTKPANDEEANDMSEDFLEGLNEEVSLEDYVPEYLNLAITFTGDDFGGDKAMMEVLMYIIIGIIAFVFAILVSNTITNEATVIGTLRASGYTNGELIRHYMTAPIIVTIISAVIGNIWGYTQMKTFIASLYYGSYSLPTYVTVWNAEAFLKTTLIPIGLMLVINYAVLRSKLSASPIKFIRRDLSRRKMKKTPHLSYIIPFFHRFRLRVIMQNVPNYIVMFLGIFLAEFLLLFGIGLGPILVNYQESIPQNMISNYQYILKIPTGVYDESHKLMSMINLADFYDEVETENEDAEEFSAYTLKSMGEKGYKIEDIMIYGCEDESRYIKAEIEEGEVYVSSAMADKYKLKEGSEVTLKEPYEKKTYSFIVDGVYEYEGAVCMFMNIDYLNEYFDLGDGYFCGYFSDTEITDINEEYIGQMIDVDTLTKVSRQLLLSMGSMMNLVQAFAVIIFIVLIYLLSKVIIEKNAQSISMAKILGYSNGEIAKLYIIPTSIMILLFLIIDILIESLVIVDVLQVAMQGRMTGWLPIDVSLNTYMKAFVYGAVTYIVVAIMEIRRIKKVPMEEALKNAE
ncbi:MAG: ABC transporter permease [Eubacterium sp.]|nr:ABC transporter permease [Eubacterium sp.]